MTWPAGAIAKIRAASLDSLLQHRDTISDADYKSGTTTTVSTSYTNSITGPCLLVFTAKASGMVLLGSTCVMSNSTTGRTLCSYQIRQGPVIAVGTVVQSPSDSNAVYMIGTDERTCTRVELLTGLTPDQQYNVQQHVRVSSGTGTFSNRSMFALPL